MINAESIAKLQQEQEVILNAIGTLSQARDAFARGEEEALVVE